MTRLWFAPRGGLFIWLFKKYLKCLKLRSALSAQFVLMIKHAEGVHINFDGFVKSRHSGENRSPEIL